MPNPKSKGFEMEIREFDPKGILGGKLRYTRWLICVVDNNTYYFIRRADMPLKGGSNTIRAYQVTKITRHPMSLSFDPTVEPLTEDPNLRTDMDAQWYKLYSSDLRYGDIYFSRLIAQYSRTAEPIIVTTVERF